MFRKIGYIVVVVNKFFMFFKKKWWRWEELNLRVSAETEIESITPPLIE